AERRPRLPAAADIAHSVTGLHDSDDRAPAHAVGCSRRGGGNSEQSTCRDEDERFPLFATTHRRHDVLPAFSWGLQYACDNSARIRKFHSPGAIGGVVFSLSPAAYRQAARSVRNARFGVRLTAARDGRFSTRDRTVRLNSAIPMTRCTRDGTRNETVKQRGQGDKQARGITREPALPITVSANSLKFYSCCSPGPCQSHITVAC